MNPPDKAARRRGQQPGGSRRRVQLCADVVDVRDLTRGSPDPAR